MVACSDKVFRSARHCSPFWRPLDVMDEEKQAAEQQLA
jgi:hypothetical protein